MGSFDQDYMPSRDAGWQAPPVETKKKPVETKEIKPETISIRLQGPKKEVEFYHPIKGKSDYVLSYATAKLVEGDQKSLENIPSKEPGETESDYMIRLSQDENVIKTVKDICYENGVSAYFYFGEGEGGKKLFDIDKIKDEKALAEMEENTRRRMRQG